VEVRDIQEEINLIQRVSAGDRGAFEKLYERFSGVLYATAFKVLNEAEAAADVLQDVFIQIWDKAAMYDPERGKPLTWAVTLTRNKAIDRLRSAQRRQRLNDEVEKEAEIFEQFNDQESMGDVDLGERSQIVRQAVLKLSKDQRQAIEMAFFSGLTQAEIAERLDQPLGTVKARIRRGMMKLRDLITPAL